MIKLSLVYLLFSILDKFDVEEYYSGRFDEVTSPAFEYAYLHAHTSTMQI